MFWFWYPRFYGDRGQGVVGYKIVFEALSVQKARTKVIEECQNSKVSASMRCFYGPFISEERAEKYRHDNEYRRKSRKSFKKMVSKRHSVCLT